MELSEEQKGLLLKILEERTAEEAVAASDRSRAARVLLLGQIVAAISGIGAALVYLIKTLANIKL